MKTEWDGEFFGSELTSEPEKNFSSQRKLALL